MSDSVGWYLKEIGRFPLLTAEQEIQLGRKVQRWVELRELDQVDLTQAQRREMKMGQRAYQKFYECNLRLVVSLAKKYINTTKSLDLMDLIQEGNVGLARAVEKFDYARGYKFSTYAYWWIRQSIHRGLQMYDRTIRLPSSALELLAKIKSFSREYHQSNGMMPPKKIVCEEFRIDTATLDHYLTFEQGCRSLDDKANKSVQDEASALIDLMSDPSQTEEALEIAAAHEVYDLVMPAIQSLPKQQAEVVQLRFFNESEPELTFKEIGARMGIHQHTASLNMRKAKRLLRVKLRHQVAA